jgi:Holliday junction resolvase-like predicted endonuclease
MRKESDIQHDVIHYFERNGWYMVKIIQSNKNGWPDLQAHKNGVTIFIEVKSETGKVSELQHYRHKQLRNMGFIVLVIHSINQLQDELITISHQLRKERYLSDSN